MRSTCRGIHGSAVLRGAAHEAGRGGLPRRADAGQRGRSMVVDVFMAFASMISVPKHPKLVAPRGWVQSAGLNVYLIYEIRRSEALWSHMLASA